METGTYYPKAPPLKSPEVRSSKQASICLLFLARWEEECGRAQDVPIEKQGPDSVRCSQLLSELIPRQWALPWAVLAWAQAFTAARRVLQGT